MQFVKSEQDDGVLVATFHRGKANAMNRAMLGEVRELIQHAADDENVRALVIGSHSTAFFCSGFDVGEVFRYDGVQMRAFFSDFVDIYEGIQKMSKGVVAAVSGHAYAGGAVLAVATDWRVMSQDPCGFALNEVNLGVILPPGVTRMVAHLLGAGYARQMLLSGEPIGPEEALRIGLVHELAPASEVLTRAIARAHEFARKPPAAFAAIKQKLLAIMDSDGGSDRHRLDTFVQQWDSAEGQAAREAILLRMNR